MEHTPTDKLKLVIRADYILIYDASDTDDEHCFALLYDESSVDFIHWFDDPAQRDANAYFTFQAITNYARLIADNARLMEALRWALDVIEDLDRGYLDDYDRQTVYGNACTLLTDLDTRTAEADADAKESL